MSKELKELQRVYDLWNDEMGDSIYVIEAVGKYLDSLKPDKPDKQVKRSKRKDETDSLYGWNKIIQEQGKK